MILRNMDVLGVPMWSSRSHKTGLYNPAHEGNLHTMVHYLENAGVKSATITRPCGTKLTGNPDGHSTSSEYLELLINSVSFDLRFECVDGLYLNNASMTKHQSMAPEIPRYRSYDKCLVGIQPVANRYFERNNTVFWGVSIAGEKNRPDYFESISGLDRTLVTFCPKTVVACVDQHERYPTAELIDQRQFFNADLYRAMGNEAHPEPSKPHFIFVPWRLSHAEYKWNEIREVLDGYYIVTTDPNDSELTNWPGRTRTSPRNYKHVLYERPIIPFVVPRDLHHHWAWHEWNFYGCTILNLEELKHGASNNFGWPQSHGQKYTSKED